jgi:hypothetical protein
MFSTLQSIFYLCRFSTASTPTALAPQGWTLVSYKSSHLLFYPNSFMYYRGHPKVNFFFYSLIFTLNHRRPKMSKFDISDKKIMKTIFFLNATSATSHSDADS